MPENWNAIAVLFAIEIATLVQKQQTYSGINQHFKALYQMTFPNMFPDYARARGEIMYPIVEEILAALGLYKRNSVMVTVPKASPAPLSRDQVNPFLYNIGGYTVIVHLATPVATAIAAVQTDQSFVSFVGKREIETILCCLASGPKSHQELATTFLGGSSVETLRLLRDLDYLATQHIVTISYLEKKIGALDVKRWVSRYSAPTSSDIERVKQSIAPLIDNEVAKDELAQAFYTQLFANRPSLEQLFGPASANYAEKMAAQRKALMGALVLAIKNVHDRPALQDVLFKLGRKHRENYNIRDEYYADVVIALFTVLSRTFGPTWQDIEESWKRILFFCIKLMLQGASQVLEPPRIPGYEQDVQIA